MNCEFGTAIVDAMQVLFSQGLPAHAATLPHTTALQFSLPDTRPSASTKGCPLERGSCVNALLQWTLAATEPQGRPALRELCALALVRKAVVSWRY